MISLSEKYRPACFEDMVAQEEAVSMLTRYVNAESAPPILLHGPPGTGKTSLARIFAAAFHCQSPKPSACGECIECRDGLSAINFYEYSAARHDTVETAKDVESWMCQVPWGKYGFFIDEVHGLQPKSADTLLKEMETPRTGRFIICATTELESVRPALRSRCQILALKPLSRSQLFGLATDICAKERISFEPEALDLLASYARGSARELVIAIDTVATKGHLTRPVLKEALSLGWTRHLLAYVTALLVADRAGENEAIEQWLASPAEKARRIKEFLLYLYNFEVCVPRLKDVVNAAFHVIEREDRLTIVQALEARARMEGLPLSRYWAELLNFWLFDPAIIADDTALSIKLHQFHQLITPGDPSQPPPCLSAEPARKRSFRARSRRDERNRARQSSETTDRSGWLSLKETERLYTAATFLTQHHGLWFNAALDIRLQGPADELETQAAALLTRITHELGLRLRAWEGAAGGQLYWIYRNQRLGNVITLRLALHVPYGQLAKAERWLQNKLEAWTSKEDLVLDHDFTAHDPAPRNVVTKEVSRRRFHWQRIRELWGGLDPDIMHWGADGKRAPLVDLLGVSIKHRLRSDPLNRLRPVGVCHGLDHKAFKEAERNNMGFLSAFQDAAWEQIDTGWELREHEDRITEQRDREDRLALVEMIGAEDSHLSQKRYQEGLDRLTAEWPDDPKLRPRSWLGWWS